MKTKNGNNSNNGKNSLIQKLEESISAYELEVKKLNQFIAEGTAALKSVQEEYNNIAAENAAMIKELAELREMEKKRCELVEKIKKEYNYNE